MNEQNLFVFSSNQYLELYNGDSTASPLIKRYCGNLLPPTFISSTNRAFIYFHTESVVESGGKGPGFVMEYNAISSKLTQLQKRLCLSL